MRRKFIKALTVFAVICIILQGVMIPSFAAAFSGGSGSEADPYVITTAEQMNAVRENLSAHYKLGATIDMSAIKNFKPIGTIAKPFKGSFKCDLNTDGFPLYAILNLNIHTQESVFIDDGMSKWEAALFAGVQNAKFENIYVLNAKIKNDNYGDNRGAVIYGDFKPGMDDMPTAPLIGKATNSTIIGCGATGSIDARSNGCGGLIGQVSGGSVQNCWSTVTVKTKGKWNPGGLVSTANENATISNCFATGDVEGTQSAIGALIGSANGVMIQNCYATGDARDGFIARIEGSTIANCYYSGKGVAGGTDVTVVSSNIVNSYYLKGNPITHEGYESGDKAKIKSALSSVADYDTSGDLPMLKTTKMPKNLKDYKAGKVFGTPTGATATPENTQSGTQSASSQESSSQAVTSSQTGATSSVVSSSSQAATSSQTVTSSEEAASSESGEPLMSVEELTKLINSLPIAELITIQNKEDIKTAAKAYESLSEVDKDAFDLLVYKKLAEAKKAVALFVVEEISNRIEALPEASKIKASNKEEIDAIWDDFNFLDEEYQTFIAEELRAKLDECTKALENAGGAEAGATASAFTTTEIIIFAALALVILLNCASNIVMSILLFKKKREQQLDGGSDYED